MILTGLEERKRALRSECAALRQRTFLQITPAERRKAGANLVRALAPAPGERVAGYVAFRSEIDPGPALQNAAGLGVLVCLPVVVGPCEPLEFWAWAPGESLEPGEYGIPIPTRRSRCRPDKLVVPLLAWDRHGGRLGYGGGFYDRTLADMRGSGVPCRAIGFAFAAQEIPQVPRDERDAGLDVLVTEREILEFG